MANFAVDDFLTSVASLTTVLAELETQLETIDNTKTIRLLDVKKIGNETFQGTLITDT